MTDGLDPDDIEELLRLGKYGFTRRVVIARARLALDDPDDETVATAPMTEGRARQILLLLGEETP
jgi:hypothetical protein